MKATGTQAAPGRLGRVILRRLFDTPHRRGRYPHLPRIKRPTQQGNTGTAT